MGLDWTAGAAAAARARAGDDAVAGDGGVVFLDGAAMNANEILIEAARIVDGDRNTTHGAKERSFAQIATMWNGYLEGRRIASRDVAQMMVLLKIVRSVQGTPTEDHFLDAAGYAAIAGGLAGVEDKPA